MKWDWRIALPFLIGAALAMLNALMDYFHAFHVNNAYGAAGLMLAMALGDYIRAQLRIAQAKNPQQTDPSQPGL